MPDRVDDRAALAEIACAGVSLQPQAERIMRTVRSRTDAGADLATRGRRVVHGYFVLRERLRELPRSEDADVLEQLLNYHQQVVEQSLLFAYGARGPRDRREVGERFAADLGAPGDALLDLAVRLRAHAGSTGPRDRGPSAVETRTPGA